MIKKNKMTIVKVWVVFFSCAFSLLVAETFLRFLFIIPAPLANYYPFPYAKLGKIIQIKQFEYETQYHYNSQGFRDKEISFEKEKGIKRLLFVGDSFTEGQGVDEDKRFSNLLLNNLGSGFEGINVGQIATNPNNYFDNIIQFGLALKPDIIILGVFLGNDFMGMGQAPLSRKYKINKSVSRIQNSLASSFFSQSWSEKFVQVVK